MDVDLTTKDKEPSNDNTKVWMTLWISFCLSLAFWFVSKMFKGRQNLHNNFAKIQSELERMHAMMEQRQQAASLKDQENGEDIDEQNGNKNEEEEENSGQEKDDAINTFEDIIAADAPEDNIKNKDVGMIVNNKDCQKQSCNTNGVVLEAVNANVDKSATQVFCDEKDVLVSEKDTCVLEPKPVQVKKDD